MKPTIQTLYTHYYNIIQSKNQFLEEYKHILDQAKKLHIIANYKNSPFREQISHFKEDIKYKYGIDIDDIPLSKFNKEVFERETLDIIVQRIRDDFWY